MSEVIVTTNHIPEKQLLAEPVRYINKRYKNMKLLYKPTITTLATDAYGGQRFLEHPGQLIQFQNYEYQTNDPDIVAWLDKHPRITGKGAKVCIEKAAPTNHLRNEFVELVNEFGEERVLSMLRKRKEKLQTEAQEVSVSKKKKKA